MDPDHFGHDEFSVMQQKCLQQVCEDDPIATMLKQINQTHGFAAWHARSGMKGQHPILCMYVNSDVENQAQKLVQYLRCYANEHKLEHWHFQWRAESPNHYWGEVNMEMERSESCSNLSNKNGIKFDICQFWSVFAEAWKKYVHAESKLSVPK